MERRGECHLFLFGSVSNARLNFRVYFPYNFEYWYSDIAFVFQSSSIVHIFL